MWRTQRYNRILTQKHHNKFSRFSWISFYIFSTTCLYQLALSICSFVQSFGSFKIIIAFYSHHLFNSRSEVNYSPIWNRASSMWFSKVRFLPVFHLNFNENCIEFGKWPEILKMTSEVKLFKRLYREFWLGTPEEGLTF